MRNSRARGIQPHTFDRDLNIQKSYPSASNRHQCCYAKDSALKGMVEMCIAEMVVEDAKR